MRTAESAVVRPITNEWSNRFSNLDLHSGPFIPPMELYPHTGSTLMDVRPQLSLRFSAVILIMIPALPAIKSFTDSDGGLYVAGDMNAYKNQYKSTATVVVSPGFRFVMHSLIPPPEVQIRPLVNYFSWRGGSRGLAID